MTVNVQLATDEALPMIVEWLNQPDVSKWLDFGPGRSVTTMGLKYGMSRGTERFFTFSAEDGGEPVGVVVN